MTKTGMHQSCVLNVVATVRSHALVPKTVAAACMLAVSPASLALAQSADTAAELPAITVETQKKKAKPVAAKKSTAPAKKSASTPTPQAPAPVEPVASAGGGGGGSNGEPGANPYADPSAPYKVDRSANTKLTEPLVDTPRTVTTISKEVLEDKQATSVRELARTTPGVTLGTGEGGNAFGDVLFIRGFRASSDAYIDGIRDPSVTVRENFNIEQVEILKGPSSSISGRGTTGGAINVIQKKPQDTNFQNFSTTFGTDDTRRVTTDVNHVFSNAFAVRANGMWQEAGVAGRDDAVFDDRWGGAFAATLKPTDTLTLTADYMHLDMDSMPDWGVPWNSRERKPFTETGLNRKTFYGVPDRDFMEGRQDVATLTGELEISKNLVLSSKLRYGHSLNDYVVSAPEAPNITNPNPDLWTVRSSPKSRYQTNEIWASQTDLTARFDTFGIQHTMVGGIEFSNESVYRTGYRGLNTEQVGTIINLGSCTVRLFNPNTANCWNDDTQQLIRGGNYSDIDVTTRAIYLQDTVKLTPQWILNGGFRVDDYEIEQENYTLNTNTSVFLNREDTLFNWNGAITYKPLPIGSVYFAYGTSSNPVGQEFDAGGNDYGGLNTGGEVFKAEQNEAYEVGTKWELFNRHVLATAALFQTTKDNARENFGGRLQDTGKYEVKGVEFGVGGNITPELSIFGGAVFMDSEVLESAIEANIGGKLVNIAHETFSLMATYQVTERLKVGGQASYADEIRGGSQLASTNGLELEERWRFDAMAELDLTNNIDLRLNVLNITNETYYDAFYRSGAPFVYIAPGRAAYLTTNFKF